MTLSIELTPQSEAWLEAEAKMQGVQPVDIIQRLIEEHAVYDPDHSKRGNGKKTPVDDENAAAIALLSQWIAEDATEDPEEIRKADEEVEELRRNLNANYLYYSTPEKHIEAMDALAEENASLPILLESVFDREHIHKDKPPLSAKNDAK